MVQFLIEISISKRDGTKEAERFCREGALGLGFEEAVQTDKEGRALQVRKTGLVTQLGVLGCLSVRGKVERRPGTRQWSLCLFVK